jgi:creatinine amidohydrolase
MSRLADTTWPEAGSARSDRRVLLVPVGATEQHGPHLPLTTDTDIAVAVAEAAAARDPGLVVSPASAYGSSGEHEDFPGTISIGQQATEALLVELGRSASRSFAHTVLVCTHGGNAAPLSRALRRLDQEGHPVVGWSPAWGGDLHAGRTETSLMLAVAPDRVRPGPWEPGARGALEDLLPLLQTRGVRAVSPNGILGDPGGADPTEGARLLEAAAAALVAFVAALRRQPEEQTVEHLVTTTGRKDSP